MKNIEKILLGLGLIVILAIAIILYAGNPPFWKYHTKTSIIAPAADPDTMDSAEPLPKSGHDQPDSVAIREYKERKRELQQYQNRKHDSLQPVRPLSKDDQTPLE